MASQSPEQAKAELESAGLRYSQDEFLHQCAIGKLPTVLTFLAAGMAADVKNDAGDSAILIAARNGHADVVRELHEAGASLESVVRSVASHATDAQIVTRLTSLSWIGTLVSGLLIAAVGWHFTNAYNNRQLALQAIQSRQNDIQASRNTDLREMEVVEKMIPHLADEKSKTVALLTIQVLARPQLATQIAVAVGGAGSAQALVRMASTATSDEVKGANIAALGKVALTSPEASMIAAPLLSDKRRAIVSAAKKTYQANPKYQYAKKTIKDGFDSSSFVAYVLSQAGLLANYTQYNSVALQKRFGIDSDSDAKMELGDLIFYSEGACMIYIGDDEMVGILPGGIIRTKVSNDIGFQRLGVGHVT